MKFRLQADFEPMGDQPQAIEALEKSLLEGNRYQTLWGVTGSGKTFTMANLIQRLQRPTLVISHNKTLAAQLYSEFKHFFPHNAVEYFVSYYDYYQPEAYVVQTDTFIEKDASINDEIERLRIAAASALLSRQDVIVVASVSCIYGLGSPEDFQEMRISLRVGEALSRESLLACLVQDLYERSDAEFSRGKFRVRGDIVDVFPAYSEEAIRIEFWGDEITSIRELDPMTGKLSGKLTEFSLYPANQYITPQHRIETAIERIEAELKERVAFFERKDRLLEAQRIQVRTRYDLEMLKEVGFCSGIENYSLHLSGRQRGERPCCLLDFFPENFLVFIDESHVTLPQIRGMYYGDRSRKQRLVDYGFRLPSALDNRPLQPSEFNEVVKQMVFVSATPSSYEWEVSAVVVPQVIRPTGLLDPIMEVRPIKGQVEDLIDESIRVVAEGSRVLVTTLTKRMSEDLTHFLRESGIRVEYLHSDIGAIERVDILRNLRCGEFDVLVGVNLLREGLDLPEVALVAILDADKEGFLRSETSLIQTAGRASRHKDGRVILYADKLTHSIERAIETTKARREKQLTYNHTHNLIPCSVTRSVQASLHIQCTKNREKDPISLTKGDKNIANVLAQLENEMLAAAEALQFERASILRDQIQILKSNPS